MKTRTTIAALMVGLVLAACRRESSRGPQESVDESPSAAPASSASASASASSSAAPKPGVVHYGDVTLHGHVAEQTFYGPPGYGEDPSKDQKESAYVLLLDAPTDVVRADGDEDWDVDREAVKKVQLADPKDPKLDLKSFVDKTVTAKGHLYGAHSAKDHTDVVMGAVDVAAD